MCQSLIGWCKIQVLHSIFTKFGLKKEMSAYYFVSKVILLTVVSKKKSIPIFNICGIIISTYLKLKRLITLIGDSKKEKKKHSLDKL